MHYTHPSIPRIHPKPHFLIKQENQAADEQVGYLSFPTHPSNAQIRVRAMESIYMMMMGYASTSQETKPPTSAPSIKDQKALNDKNNNIYLNCLCAEFLDVALFAIESKRHNTRDVHIWAINMQIKTQFLANGLDILQALLVIRTCSSNPDLDLVLVE